ncbi:MULTISPECIES: hypothetical protein [unclassified Clostridium]|uniref:hypothetical protein n=1 Tax=unclassified Clostridium TaxID=2614128 RepID=UPI000297978B|nr:MULTISPECIES: hypothetical protein [unclassified Clostridium]EKQ56002.1 MAG: hypothetical protein A370_02404 [Clostridium sp. Maddingley MBC34-26]
MVIIISNKEIHKYKYTRRKLFFKDRKVKKIKKSFGEVYKDVQELKKQGIISASSINANISEAIKKSINRKMH